MLFKNYKEYSKAVDNVFKFEKYIVGLFKKINADHNYYREEIENNDYNDEDLEAIVKGCFNKTELDLIHIFLTYWACIHNLDSHKYYNYYDGLYNSNILYVLIIYLKYNISFSLHRNESEFKPKNKSYKEYKKWFYGKYNNSIYSNFDELCIALNKYQSDDYYIKPIEHEKTNIVLSDDSDDEPENIIDCDLYLKEEE